MTTKQLIHHWGLQGIVDYVLSYPTRKEGCKRLGISYQHFTMVKYILEHGNIDILKGVNEGKVPYSRAYREIGKHKISKNDPLSMLSEKAKESIGKVSPYTSHLIKWGMLDINAYIDHYMTTGYGKKTQDRAIMAHYYLMYEGHESNYLQMRGVVAEFATIKSVYGTITKEHRELLKRGVYCHGTTK